MEANNNHSNKETSILINDLFFNVEVARYFKNQLMENLATNTKEINLDLTRVKLLDSIAVGILVQAQMMCLQEEVKFNIINVNKEIMELLKQIKLDKILNVVPGFDNFDNKN